MVTFKKATKKSAKLRIGLTGIAGSGKTWSALELATGLGGNIVLLDTERRGHLYGNDFSFDIYELDAPYSSERYIEIIKAAEKEGYNTLIIDSLSHAWSGDGGILSLVESTASIAKNSNTYMAWGKASPKHNKLIDTIITSNMHVIITLRSKSEYTHEINEKGKLVPKKIGMAPIQRDGIEYEMTVFCELDLDHVANITKDNTRLYQGQNLVLTRDIGAKLKEWMDSGKTTEEIKEQELKEIIEKYQSQFNSINDVDELRSALRIAQSIHPIYKTIIQAEAMNRHSQLTISAIN